MIYRVLFAPEAESDIRSIYDYILERTKSPETALDYIGRIRKACDGLGEFPDRGTRRDHLSPGLRTMGFERRATIVFAVQTTEVRIFRVLYGGRDLNGMTL